MTSDLHEMQLSVRSFLAATPYSYVLLDTKLVIQAASGAYLSMTGVMEEEILGMPVFEAFPPSPENPDDGMERVLASMEAALQKGVTDAIEVQSRHNGNGKHCSRCEYSRTPR